MKRRPPVRSIFLAGLCALLAAPLSADLTAVEVDALTAGTAATWFGYAVDAEQDLLLVGARYEDEAGLSAAGAAHLFAYEGASWIEIQRLVSSAPIANSNFGFALALDGDTLAVGQPFNTSSGGGWVHIFVNSGSGWTFQQAVQSDLPGFDYFGAELDLAGDRLIVGSTQAQASTGFVSGAAFVFRREAGIWVQEAKLEGHSALGAKGMGVGVAFDGDARAIVGAVSHSPSGSAFIYTRHGQVWTETHELIGPGSTFTDFGGSVALEGNTAAISATSDGDGSVHVYAFDGQSWQSSATLQATGPSNFFGYGLCLKGNLIFASEISSTSRIHAFGRQGNDWTLLDQFTGSGTSPGFGFGGSMAYSGSRLFAGEFGGFGVGAIGTTYVFELQADPPVNYCTSGTSASGCTAQITATGQPSATATSGFDLIATQVEGSKRGLFYWSSNGRQANPWGSSNSLQCVVPPVFRGALLPETGTTGSCDATFTYDLNARWTAKPWQNPGTGAVVQAQFWHRDPLSPSNLGTSLSNAIEFTALP